MREGAAAIAGLVPSPRSRSTSPSTRPKKARNVKIEALGESIEMDLGKQPSLSCESVKKPIVLEDLSLGPRQIFAEACCLSPKDNTTVETAFQAWSPCDNMAYQAPLKEKLDAKEETHETAESETQETVESETRECEQDNDRYESVEERSVSLLATTQDKAADDESSEEDDEDDETDADATLLSSLPVQLVELKSRLKELTAVNASLVQQQKGDDVSVATSVASPRNRRGKREKLDAANVPKPLDLDFNNIYEVQGKCHTLESEIETVLQRMSLVVTEKQIKETKSANKMQRLKEKVVNLKRQNEEKVDQVQSLAVKADDRDVKATALTVEVNTLRDALQEVSSQADQYKTKLELVQEKLKAAEQTEEKFATLEKTHMEHVADADSRVVFLEGQVKEQRDQIISMTEEARETEKKLEISEQTHNEYVTNADSRITFLEGQVKEQRSQITKMAEEVQSREEMEYNLRKEYSEKFEDDLRKAAVKAASFRVQVEALEEDRDNSKDTIRKSQEKNSKLREKLLDMSQVLLKVSKDTENRILDMKKEKEQAEQIFQDQLAEERAAQNELREATARSTKTMIHTERAMAEARYNDLASSKGRRDYEADENPHVLTLEAELALVQQRADSQAKFVDELLDQLDVALEEKSALHVTVDELQQLVDSMSAQNKKLQVQVESSRFVQNLLPTVGLPSLTARQSSENQQLKIQLEEAVSQLASLEMDNYKLRSNIDTAEKKVVEYAEKAKEAADIVEQEREVATNALRNFERERIHSKDHQTEVERIKAQLDQYKTEASTYQEKIEDQQQVLKALEAEKESLQAGLEAEIESIEEGFKKELASMVPSTVHEDAKKEAECIIESMELEKLHLRDEISILQDKSASLEAELADYRSKYHAMHKETDEETTEKVELLVAEKRTLQEEIDTLKEKCSELATKLSEARTKNHPRQLETQLPSTPKKATTPNNKAKSLHSERKKLDIEIKFLKEKCSSLEKELKEAQTKLSSANSDRKVDGLRKKMQATQREKQSVEKELVTLKDKVVSLEQELVNVQKDYNDTVATTQKIKKRTKALSEELSTKKAELTQQSQTIKALENENSKLTGKVVELSGAVSRLSSDKKIESDANRSLESQLEEERKARDEIQIQLARSTKTILSTKMRLSEAKLTFMNIEQEEKLTQSRTLSDAMLEHDHRHLQIPEQRVGLIAEAHQSQNVALEKEVAALHGEVARLQEDTPIVGQDMNDLEELVDTLSKHNKQLQTDLVEQITKREDADANISTLKSVIAKLLNSASESEESTAEMERLQSNLQDEVAKRTAAEETAKSLQQTLETKNDSLTALTKTLEDEKLVSSERLHEYKSLTIAVEKSQGELDRLNEELAQSQTTIGDLESRLQASTTEYEARLEESRKEQSIEMDRLKNDISALEAAKEEARGLLNKSEGEMQSQIHDLNVQISKLSSERNELELATEKAKQEMMAKLDVLSAHVEELESEKKTLTELAAQDLETAIAEVQKSTETIAHLEREISAMNQKAKQSEDEARTCLENAQSKAKQSEDEARTCLENAQSNIDRLECEKNDLQNRLDNTKSLWDQEKSKLEQSLQAVITDFEAKKVELAETNTLLQSLQSDMQVLNEKHAAELQSVNEEHNSTLATVRAQLSQLENEKSSIQQEVSKTRALSATSYVEVEDYKQRLHRETQKLEDANHEIRVLETKLEGMLSAHETSAHETMIATLKSDHEQQLEELSQSMKEQMKALTEDATSEYIVMDAEASKLRSELDEVNALLLNAQSMENSLQAQFSEKLAEHEESTSKLQRQHASEIERLQSQKKDVEKQLVDVKSKVESMGKVQEELSSQLAQKTSLESKIHDLQEHLSIAETAVKQSQQAYAEASTKLASMEEVLTVTRKTSSNLEAEKAELMKEHGKIESELKSHNVGLSKRVEDLARQLDEQIEKYKESVDRQSQAEKSVQSLETSLDTISSQLAEAKELNSDLQSSKVALEQTLETMVQKLETEQSSHTTTKSELSEATENLNNLESKHSQVSEQMKVLENEKARLQSDINQMVCDLKEAESALASSRVEITNKVAQLTGIQGIEAKYSGVLSERDSLLAKIEETQTTVTSLATEKAQIETDLASSKKQYEELSSEYATTKESLAAERSTAFSKSMALQGEFEKISIELQTTKDQLAESQTRYRQLVEEKETFGGQHAKLSVDYDQACNRITALESALADAQQKLTETGTLYKNVDETLKQRDLEVKESQHHISELRKNLQDLQTTIEDEIASKEKALESWNNDKENLQNELQEKATRVTDLERSNATSNIELGKTKDKLMAVNESLETVTLSLEEMTSANHELSATVGDLEMQLEASTQELSSAVSHLKTLREQNADLDHQVKCLADDLESTKDDLKSALAREAALKKDVDQTQEQASDEKFANTMLKNLIGTLNARNDTLQEKCNKLVAQVKVSVNKESLEQMTNERDTLILKEKKLSTIIDDLESSNKESEQRLQKTLDSNSHLEMKLVETKDTILDLSRTIETMRSEHSRRSNDSESRESSLAKEVVGLQLQIETMKRHVEKYKNGQEQQEFVAAELSTELDQLKQNFAKLEKERNELRLDVERTQSFAKEKTAEYSKELKAEMARGQALDEKLQRAESSLMELSETSETMRRELTQELELSNARETRLNRELTALQSQLSTHRRRPQRHERQQVRVSPPTIDEFQEIQSEEIDEDEPFDMQSTATSNSVQSNTFRNEDDELGELRMSSPRPMDARSCRKQSMARRTPTRRPSSRNGGGGGNSTFDDDQSVNSSYSRRSVTFADDRSVESGQLRPRVTFDDRSVESSASSKRGFWGRR